MASNTKMCFDAIAIRHKLDKIMKADVDDWYVLISECREFALLHEKDMREASKGASIQEMSDFISPFIEYVVASEKE